jgi:hypothetical protein
MVDDDARDERLAAWLEPEPLDDVTRRRLVSTAMRDTRSSRAVRWIATAAAIVVVLVGGLALITARGGNDEHEAATPALTPANDRAGLNTTTTPPFADTAAPEAAGSAAVAPVDVGGFGDLDRAANLARLRTALEGSGSALASGKAASQSTSGAAAALAALPCRDRLPAGTTIAIGTGTLDGRAAVVVLTDPGGGTRSIDAVLADPCEVRPLS